MNKKDLLFELSNNTYATLKPSGIHGIGVFAICDIPKGTKNIFSSDKSEWHKVEKKEVDALPGHAKALVENHCLYDEDHYFIPEYGFKVFIIFEQIITQIGAEHRRRHNIFSLHF